MREVLVDTNVLVSFLTTRNAKQQQQAADLFLAAAERKLRLLLHSMALSEVVYVLSNSYSVAPLAVSQAMRKLVAQPGVVTAVDVPWPGVLDRWPAMFPSFGDALLAAFAKDAGVDAVATFDRGFRKRLARDGTAAYWR